jgi:hypothetical protein
MMAEGDRLRRLEMGEARHHRAGMRLGQPQQHALQRLQARVGPLHGVAHPELEVGGDLVVARAGGVQATARLPDQIGESLLDVEMDVFKLRRERERAGGDAGLDLVQTAQDRVALRVRDHHRRGQHPGVRP